MVSCSFLAVGIADIPQEPRCVLCPRDNSSVKNVKSKKPGMDFDIFSAFKPTEGNLWAHVLCSLFIPEVLYRDPKTLKVIEGITTLPEERWQEVSCPPNVILSRAHTTQTCSLCNQQDGAVITCVECLAPFHTSCAWMSGYKFGFEFTLVSRSKRPDVVALITTRRKRASARSSLLRGSRITKGSCYLDVGASRMI